MRGNPKTIKTKQDLINCAELVQSGEIDKIVFLFIIEQIENQKWHAVPIIEISENRKEIIVRDMHEAQPGMIVKNGIDTTIESVAHVQQTTETPNTLTTIVLDQSLDDKEILYIPDNPSPFDRLGIAEPELNALRESVEIT